MDQLKLTHLPTEALDVIAASLASSQHAQMGVRDVLNLRRTAKPFDDIRVRPTTKGQQRRLKAARPTKSTMPKASNALHKARKGNKAVVEQGLRHLRLSR
jgi:hypothetical protein|eukprot:SAG25_NODE_1579_length_2740_cov_26.210905_1_plen_100_part_00